METVCSVKNMVFTEMVESRILIVIGLGRGMTYLPEESKVVYRSKDGKEEKTFDALEWLAAMCSHVPNKGRFVTSVFTAM